MPDIFSSYSKGLDSPYETAELITAVGGADQTFANVTRAIYLSTAGTLVCTMNDGADKTLVLGTGWHRLRVRGIKASGSSSAVGFGAW